MNTHRPVAIAITRLGLLLRIVMLLAVATGAVSCTCLTTKKVDGDFEGLKTALDRTKSKGTLRLLLVHGMTRHEPGWSSTLVTGITTRLQLLRDAGADSRTNFSLQNHPMGELRISQFTNSGATSRLRVYELTWSEITQPWKEKQFGNDESEFHRKERVLVNRSLKSGIMNDGFGDAVLYAGSFRQHMQYPIMQAVMRMLADQPDPDDEVAIITTSLGSYMTLDTLARMSRGFKIMGEAPFKPERVRDLLDQITQIFMLANQVPLLELSEVSNPPGGVRATNNLPGLQGFLQVRKEVRQKKANPKQDVPRWKLRIVAFSDPNDLLTYPLGPQDVANEGELDVSVRNVTVSVERHAILGIFAWPLTAHTGHDKSDKVLELIVNGYP